MLDRRQFVACAGISAAVALGFSGEKSAYAEESSVPFTAENAMKAATVFAQGFEDGAGAQASSSIELFDQTGTFIGYIVSYERNGVPYGYAVLDRTSDLLFVDFSFGEDVLLPYESPTSKMAESYSANQVKFAVRYSPLVYGAATTNSDAIRLNTGALNSWPSLDVSMLSGGTALDNFTVPTNYLWNTCTITSTHLWTEFISYDQWDFIFECGRYGCFVTACYALLDHWYQINNWPPSKKIYDDLWKYTDTFQINSDDGIVRGGTLIDSGSKGFARYCKEKYGSHGNSSVTEPVDPATLIKALDDGKGCILSIRPDSGDDHACVVEGYVRATDPNGTNGVYYALYDGWYTSVRYINLVPYYPGGWPFGAAFIW